MPDQGAFFQRGFRGAARHGTSGEREAVMKEDQVSPVPTTQGPSWPRSPTWRGVCWFEWGECKSLEYGEGFRSWLFSENIKDFNAVRPHVHSHVLLTPLWARGSSWAGPSSSLCSPHLGSQTEKPQISDLFLVKHIPLRMGRLSPEVSLENQYCLGCLMGKSMLVIRKPC